MAFNGDVASELASQFLALANKGATTAAKMIGHRLTGMSFLHTAEIAKGRLHLDDAIALYDPAGHRSLATRFGHESGVSILSFRSLALWLLGYPEAALRDADDALKYAREIGQAGTLMYALVITPFALFHRGDYPKANALLDEAIHLADEKDAAFWKAWGMMQRGCVLTLTGKHADAVGAITSGITSWQSTGSTIYLPLYLTYLAKAFAAIGQVNDARRYMGEAMSAMDTTKEKWAQAELHRAAGEMALLEPERDAARAEGHFQSSLAIARAHEARSWELRAAMSLARLWRDQGKAKEARELLAPVYGWFTEGFDTRDLKEAKALLNELAA